MPNGNVATAGAVQASIMPVGEGCTAFAGWGDAKAAARAEADAANHKRLAAEV